jgi:hypothetical protein
VVLLKEGVEGIDVRLLDGQVEVEVPEGTGGVAVGPNASPACGPGGRVVHGHGRDAVQTRSVGRQLGQRVVRMVVGGVADEGVGVVGEAGLTLTL